LKLGLLLFLALSLPLASARAASTEELQKTWANSGFNRPVVISLNRSQLTDPTDAATRLTHQFSLTAVIYRDAGWSADEVESHIKRTAHIYAQCGIAISSATLVLADSPNGWIDIDGQTSGPNGNTERMAQMIPGRDRPVAFYVRSCRGGQTAFANPVFYSEKGAPGVNTVWITLDVITPAYLKLRDPSYVPDAHELAHLLTNGGHVDDDSVRNVLSDYIDLVNDRFTPDQCARMKSSPLVSPL
jgi:hypothetical protein